MSSSWQPKNFEEACKRNAGRRKRHMRMRKERADRILRLLAAMEAAQELRESAYGWLALTAETMKKSKATASRDFALARRLHGQFAQLFGRPLNPKQDRIKWSWDWSHYGFRTQESLRSGHKKPVGNFPFDTRAEVTEDAFGGFGPKSWQSGRVDLSGIATRDLVSLLRSD
jgi:hypothetical protein